MAAASGTAILASAFAAVPATQALAQEAVALDEITVTGSRIRRQDFTANSPIMTVDEDQFIETATIGVETVLNRLPQFVPAVTQFTTSDVQQTATNTVGISTVSLRGLGPNRNLVLIDGRRLMPVDPRMVVDTNQIPSAAIERVEVISGGASAVYGADAVGGVVNFVLKDDFEGATVDVTLGDTQHGGNQEVTLSGLLGASMADGRGNVMLGVERSTRSKQTMQQRDWRVADMANPSTPATAFGWGSDTWISNEFLTVGNLPDQSVVNAMFSEAQPCTEDTGPPFFDPVCPQTEVQTNLGVPAGTFFGGTTRFLVNRDPGGQGTVYTGLMQSAGAAGSYRYAGPLNQEPSGAFQGLPYRVFQPDGTIKENNFWQWASLPLERLSSFARGHFEIDENMRLTGQAMFTRTQSETSLGLSSDLITLWGALVPFSNDLYEGDPDRNIPSSVQEDGSTHPFYLPGGRFDLNCSPTGGCTEREVWPMPPDIVTLFDSRPDAEAPLWVNRPPDYMRDVAGPRQGNNTTNTFQLSLGVEGEVFGGNHFWDVTISTGRTDNQVIQSGSARLSTYREIMSWPNFGVDYVGNANPYGTGFAEGVPTCTSGLPVIREFQVSEDCILMMVPNLQNRNELTQNVVEANLVGTLAEMQAGPLQYAVGAAYRENEYSFTPDNLSLNQNQTDPIAGLFPNEPSDGEFDVRELYGELLIPIVSDGPTGVHHFNLELGGRISDWSMPQISNLGSYKGLIDWAITPNYRIRGGWNRAHRAPNLAELFVARTQVFAGAGAPTGDQCSQRNEGPFSANPESAGAEQAAQTEAICRALMGEVAASAYYDDRPLGEQPEVGGVGIPNSFGNPDLREERADTWTLGAVMNVAPNWTLTLDWYEIEVGDLIALEGGDAIYQRCLSIAQNPDGDPNAPACQQINRNPVDGSGANIDRSFTNQGRVKVSGIDLGVNWSAPLARGGLNLNVVANYNLRSETQERPELEAIDWAGTTGCALQIDCQGYDYRVFSTVGYFQGPWNLTLRHQFWPSIDSSACITQGVDSTGCRFGGVQESYQLFALSGGYRFGDRYTVRFGIENLLDTRPPRTGGNPEAEPFPIPATRIGGGLGAGAGATYDPLGRRGFVTLRMDF